jgi:hypothetical protein
VDKLLTSLRIRAGIKPHDRTFRSQLISFTIGPKYEKAPVVLYMKDKNGVYLDCAFVSSSLYQGMKER